MTPQLLGASPLLLSGLGADAIDAFLTTHPKPSSSEVADYLKAFPESERYTQAQALLARGVDTKAVSSALKWLEGSGRVRSNWPTIAGILSVASASASAYHGYKRNASIGWAVVWFGLGSIFPVVTPVIALAQGFGKPKKGH
jgi:hypothetical protein